MENRLFFLILASGIFYTSLIPITSLEWDSYSYLLNTRFFSGNGKYIEWSRPPLFSLFIAIMNTIFGESLILIRLFSVSLSLLAIYLTYLLGKNLFNDNIGFLSALFLSTNPIFIFWSSKIYADIPLILCMSLSLIFLYQGTKKGLKKFFIISGFFAGIGILIKYVGVLIYPISFFFILFSDKKQMINLLIFGITSFLIIFPWLAFNFIKFEDPFFSLKISAGQTTFYSSNILHYLITGPIYLNFSLFFLPEIIKRVSLRKKNYLILSLSIVIIFSFFQFDSRKEVRYMLTLLPYWYILFSDSISSKKMNLEKIKIFVIISLFGFMIFTAFTISTKNHIQEASVLIKNITTDDTVIISNEWVEVGYYSNRMAKWFPEKEEFLYQQMKYYNIDYIVFIERSGAPQSEPKWATTEFLDSATYLEKVSIMEDNYPKIHIYKFKEERSSFEKINVIENKLLKSDYKYDLE